MCIRDRSCGALDHSREMTRAALLLFEILLRNVPTSPGAYSRVRSLVSTYAYTRGFFFSKPPVLDIGKPGNQEGYPDGVSAF